MLTDTISAPTTPGRARFTGLIRALCVSLAVVQLACGDATDPGVRGSTPGLGPGEPVAIVARSASQDSALTVGGGARRVVVQVVDAAGRGVPGVSLEWRVLAGGGSVQPAAPESGTDGSVLADWTPGPRVESQAIEVSAAGLPPLRLFVTASMPDSVVVARPGSSVAVDTIEAWIDDYVRVEVRLPDGRPVAGVPVDFAVTSGGGRLSDERALTDSLGLAGVAWGLGPVVGAQTVVAQVADSERSPGLSLRAVKAPGSLTASEAGVTFEALAVAGNPVRVVALRDSTLLDALGATSHVPLRVHDRLGNRADPGQVTWTSLDTSRVSVSRDGLVVAVGDGSTSLIVNASVAADTVVAVVHRKPAALLVPLAPDTMNRLGDTLPVQPITVDRLGSPIPGPSPTVSVLTPQLVTTVPGGLVPTAPGALLLELVGSGLVDTVEVFIRQVVASLAVARAADTVLLDDQLVPAVAAFDSNGFAVANPPLALQVTDPAVAAPTPRGALRALLPGSTRVTVSSGTGAAWFDLTVEGVALLVGGQRRTTLGALGGPERIEITNGRIRLVWDPPELWEAGGVDLDVRLGSVWQPANARHWGDWLYIGYSVMHLPTRITVVEESRDRVGVEMQFDDHWFAPPGYQAPADWVPQPYPFARTVWLRRADNGYYSWVDLQADLGRLDVEHENGFGGVWGPATIRTSQLTFRTDTLKGTVVYNGNPRTADLSGALTEAAEFVRDGDPVRRVLVPLPGAPFITPVFPDVGYGSVYVYRGPSIDFGAYMYADAGGGPPARAVCAGAWANAPFALPAVSPDELASCGPP